jgi:hypothetical protein
MADSIPYATPAVGRSHWPAAILCFTGLGLATIGGCFLIGVMIITSPTVAFGPTGAGQLTDAQVVLVSVLYVMATISFVGAAALIVKGVRSLSQTT